MKSKRLLIAAKWSNSVISDHIPNNIDIISIIIDSRTKKEKKKKFTVPFFQLQNLPSLSQRCKAISSKTFSCFSHLPSQLDAVVRNTLRDTFSLVVALDRTILRRITKLHHSVLPYLLILCLPITSLLLVISNSKLLLS